MYILRFFIFDHSALADRPLCVGVLRRTRTLHNNARATSKADGKKKIVFYLRDFTRKRYNIVRNTRSLPDSISVVFRFLSFAVTRTVSHTLHWHAIIIESFPIFRSPSPAVPSPEDNVYDGRSRENLNAGREWKRAKTIVLSPREYGLGLARV